MLNTIEKSIGLASVAKHSKVVEKLQQGKLDAYIEQQNNEPFFILLYSYEKNDFIIIEIDQDPDVRSYYRMKKRLRANQEKFDYHVTLTFPDKPEGVYPNGIKFKSKETLSSIRFNYTFSGYMRKFWNKMQQHKRNQQLKLYKYFWKYEQGSKTNRPHIHSFVGAEDYFLMPFIDKMKPVFRKTEVVDKKWTKQSAWLADGYLPAVPIAFHEELMTTWNSGFVHIDPINNTGVRKYLEKYVSKKGACNKRLPYVRERKDIREGIQHRIGKPVRTFVRRWGTSRSIAAPKKSGNYLFIMQGRDREELEEIAKLCDYKSYRSKEWCMWDEQISPEERGYYLPDRKKLKWTTVLRCKILTIKYKIKVNIG